MAKKKFKKIRAIGSIGEQRPTGEKGIDKILAKRGEQQNIGHGRLVTTVGSLDDIKLNMTDGWEIMWCQMSKLIPGTRSNAK